MPLDVEGYMNFVGVDNYNMYRFVAGVALAFEITTPPGAGSGPTFSRTFNYTPRTSRNMFIYRAVDNIELNEIYTTGRFELQVGGTEAKYFANSAKNAYLYGAGHGTYRPLYSKGFTVVKGRNQVSNAYSVWSPHTDGLGAFIIHEPMLSTVKFVK